MLRKRAVVVAAVARGAAEPPWAASAEAPWVASAGPTSVVSAAPVSAVWAAHISAVSAKVMSAASGSVTWTAYTEIISPAAAFTTTALAAPITRHTTRKPYRTPAPTEWRFEAAAARPRHT